MRCTNNQFSPRVLHPATNILHYGKEERMTRWKANWISLASLSGPTPVRTVNYKILMWFLDNSCDRESARCRNDEMETMDS